MDFFVLKLCWKNIWRNKRRTLLTINAIGFGVMALVGIYNYYDGFHEQVIHNVIRYQSGHLVIGFPGYQTKNQTSLFLKNPVNVEKWLSKRPEVKAMSERVIVQGLVSSAVGSANILFMGIEPKQERRVTRFAANVIKGKYIEPGKDKPILLGKALSRLLKVDVGSKVVALTQGVDGSIGNELFHVAGIFETQSDADKSLAFINIGDARTLLSLPPHAVHQVSVVLRQETDLDPVYGDFQAAFPKGSHVEVMSWKQVQRPLMAMIELNKSANRLLMIIILFVAAMGIANSILMSIMERTREFGVMMAIGTLKKEVIQMVVMETMLLSGVGVLLGNLLGIGITLYFNKYGFDLRWLTSQSIVVQGTIIQTISYPTVRWANSVMITTCILSLSLVVSVIPIRHIAKLRAVEALRAH